ncbi:unnamed protein product [Absidia cylindrospora]
MPPPRRTPLRHGSPIDRSAASRQSPNDSARITTFGNRGQSVSPIRPRTASMLGLSPTTTSTTNTTTTINNINTTAAPDISTHDISFLHTGNNNNSSMMASPDLLQSQASQFLQQQRQRHQRSSHNESLGSPLHDQSSFFGARHDARRFILSDISLASTHNPYPQHQDTREYRLRALRDGALLQQLNQSATFFAEKVMAITNDTDDVYCLAQAYYQSQQYEQALDILNKKQTLNKSVQCRYLAGLCAMALENWEDAIDYLGHDNPFVDKDFTHNHSRDGVIKLESIMCFARGEAYLQLKETDKAKTCFKEALTVDVKCYDALEALVRHNMLEEKAEWEFIMTLPYEAHCDGDADLFRDLYMLQLKRYSHSNDIAAAQRRTEHDYAMENSLDVMHSTAETLLSESKYEDCLKMCERIREVDGLYRKCLPTYLSCLYELRRKNDLFQVAQQLVDRLNDEAVTWHAVGTYYLCIERYAEARQYFSQASTMDPHFEAAWLGLGHAFAAERDHEHAINAYKTCSEMVSGSHLPYMYIGMQYMEQGNMELTLTHLNNSLERCENDPFLHIEFGVYYYNVERYAESLGSLKKASTLATDNRQTPTSPIWGEIWANMGHTHRKLQNYDRSMECYKEALSVNPQNSNVLAGIGLLYYYQADYGNATEQFNRALRNSTTPDLIVGLLEKALTANATEPIDDQDRYRLDNYLTFTDIRIDS